MAKGKKTGGRKLGTPNRATTQRMAELKAGGLMPLDFMLAEMRNSDASPEVRRAMAIAAAPYCHPRIASIDARTEETAVVHMRYDAGEEIRRRLDRLAERRAEEQS